MEKGGDVFAKHVVDADDEIRPMEEVIVLTENGRLLAVGKTLLSAFEMQNFTRGVAVKIRQGTLRNVKKGKTN